MQCPKCGESNALAYTTDNCCWECGHDFSARLVQLAAPAKSEEEIAAEKDAAAKKKSASLFRSLVKAVAGGMNHIRAAELVTGTIKTNSVAVATYLVRMIRDDASLAKVWQVMSPHEKQIAN